MPTSKRRGTVNLEPGLHETLKRLAELQGRPLSGTLNELLGGIQQPLQRTVALLEAAEQAPQEVREGLWETVDNLDRDIRQSVSNGSEGVDQLTRALEASNPHTVTRGSHGGDSHPEGGDTGSKEGQS